MLTRFFSWTGRNIDGVLAIVATSVIAVLELINKDEDQSLFYGGILLVLGVMAVAVLRDRVRQDQAWAEIREKLDIAVGVEPALESVRLTLQGVANAVSDTSMVRVLSWAEVHLTLAEGRRSTDRWLFRGGTGTFIRAVTLPECVANARRDRRALLVRLEIIDPTNVEVCGTYSRFRRSLSAEQTDWTLERTQREAYASIIAAAWYRQRYELLDIEVGLSPVMPTLRWDLSARSLVITQESPGGLALMVENGKLLYEYTQTELRKSFEQTRRVPLELARDVSLSDEPRVDEVVMLFRALNMPLPSSVLDVDVEDMVQRALHAENQYY